MSWDLDHFGSTSNDVMFARTKSRNSMPGQRNFIAHMAMMKMHHSKHVCWDLPRKMRRSLTRQCEGNAAAQHKKIMATKNETVDVGGFKCNELSYLVCNCWD